VAERDGRAALGFAGERGGVAVDEELSLLAALDGELLSDHGPRSGDEAASTLLRLYRDRGDALEPPEGSFAAAIWDERRETLVLVTDRLGRRPLYFVRSGRSILAAGELKALVAEGVRPELDLDAWAEILAYEHPLGEHTPLAPRRAAGAADARARAATRGAGRTARGPHARRTGAAHVRPSACC
jgi:asparagine synthetase B (glutamine-hydrolysing)